MFNKNMLLTDIMRIKREATERNKLKIMDFCVQHTKLSTTEIKEILNICEIIIDDAINEFSFRIDEYDKE